MIDNKQKLASKICQFLQQSIADGTIKADDAEGIEVATQCIAEAFGIDANKLEQDEQGSKPTNLLSIFNVFLATQKKLGSDNISSEPRSGPTDAQKMQAEEFKAAGNKLMAGKMFPQAIEKYTQAIALDATNAVYFANRAAAHSQDGNHDDAAVDARSSIKLDPSYSKGYSRLGHALFCVGKYSESIEAYEGGLKIEPGNASMLQAIQAANAKLATSSTASRSTSAPGNSDSGAMPDLAGMGGLGGMDFSAMMSNPNFMSMAAKMMNNPQIAEMMKNPEMAKMAQNMMSDPNALSGLLNNPKMAAMAEQFGKK